MTMLPPPVHRWHCPACDLEHVTREAQPHTPFHSCRAMAGLSTPFVPAGVRAEHRRVERPDFVGDELVQLDADGRPAFAIETHREDGYDCTIFAGTARATAHGMES